MDLLPKQGISFLLLTLYIFQIICMGHSQLEPVVDTESLRDSPSQGSNGDLASLENVFLQKLLNEYGTNGLVTVEQLQNLIKNIQVNLQSKSHVPSEEPHVIDGEYSISHETKNTTTEISAVSERCPDPEDRDCHTRECLSVNGIFRHHDLSPEESANGTKLEQMSPTVLYQLQNPKCSFDKSEKHLTVKRRPLASQVWGYGFLCVTLINLCALMGMVFLPLMQRSFYQKMLMYMVALAVGTLTGSGLIFLIPESLEMTAPDSEYKDIYVWRCLTIGGGIYLFFLIERLLKMIIKRKREEIARAEEEALEAQKKLLFPGPDEDKEMSDLPIASVPTHSVHREESINMSFKPVPTNIQSSNNYQLRPDSSSARLVEKSGGGAAENGDTEVQVANGMNGMHGHSHGDGAVNIRSVAWMVIFGDGLHNFIDGLSIGAAFSGSIMTGISVSLAVICEELPHELGDFAILLNSGMTMRQALGYNFLSACMCYLGLIIGILVGEATHGAVWIFAVAGGMFLYIALVDMLPEVNHAAEEEEAATGATWSVFCIQNAGLLSGMGIMVLLAVFSGQIDLSYLES